MSCRNRIFISNGTSWRALLIHARDHEGWDLSGSCGNDEQEVDLGYILRIEFIRLGFNFVY